MIKNDDYAEVSVKGNSRKYMFQNRMKGILIILLGLAVSYLCAVLFGLQFSALILV